MSELSQQLTGQNNVFLPARGENELFLNYQYKESSVDTQTERGEGNKKQTDRQTEKHFRLKIKYWQNIKKEIYAVVTQHFLWRKDGLGHVRIMSQYS